LGVVVGTVVVVGDVSGVVVGVMVVVGSVVVVGVRVGFSVVSGVVGLVRGVLLRPSLRIRHCITAAFRSLYS